MKEYEFTLVLATPEVSEEDADRLYEAGCGDGSISTSGGLTRIDFHRRAASLEDAIRSASENVQAAGFRVAKIQMAPPPLAGPRQPGSAIGKLTITEDDDAHLEDFKEYMR